MYPVESSFKPTDTDTKDNKAIPKNQHIPDSNGDKALEALFVRVLSDELHSDVLPLLRQGIDLSRLFVERILSPPATESTIRLLSAQAVSRTMTAAIYLLSGREKVQFYGRNGSSYNATNIDSAISLTAAYKSSLLQVIPDITFSRDL